MTDKTKRNIILRHPVINACLVVFCTLALSACVTSPAPPKSIYYVLDPKPQSFASKTASQQYKLLPVTLPDYMNQPNLVLKLSGHEIKITHYHFWAEDLRRSIQGVISNELNLANSDISFLPSCARCGQIAITIYHFYPTESGDVFLSGSFQINPDNAPQQHHSFSYSRSLQDGGYNEAVSVMRALLDELVLDINKHL
jgi:uncharacterized lipoprotein YmbA